MHHHLSKILKTFPLLVLAILMYSCNGNKETTLLRLKLKKGEVFIVTSETNTESGVASLHNKARATFTVDSVSGTGDRFYLSVKTNSIRSKAGSDGDITSYDSNKEESEMTNDEMSIHEEYKPVLDSLIHICVDDRGQVIEPFSFPGGREVPVAARPIDMSNFLIIFPVSPVKEGEEWSTEKTSSVTKGKTRSTYSIKEVNDDEIEIGLTGSVESPLKIGDPNKQTGVYKLNKQNHRLKSATIETQLSSLAGKGRVIISIYCN